MPRFFFNLYDDVVVADEEGVELPGVEAARLLALVSARDLMGAQVHHGYIVLSHWIDVLDETGAIVLHLPFGDALEIRR